MMLAVRAELAEHGGADLPVQEPATLTTMTE